MKKIGSLKPHSTPATLMWLEANYESMDGVCIPRNALYKQYADFCKCHNVQPVNAASFGKILRQKFPRLTTRRLGTRGKSRYHYYGIAVKPESGLYNQVHQYYYDIPYFKCEAKSLKSRQTGERKTQLFSSDVFKFPSTEILTNLPPSIPKNNMENILIMYTLHCSQIIEYSAHLRFHESCVVHFWNNFPDHLTDLLKSNSVISLIGICDSIMYQTICQSGIPILTTEDVPPHTALHYVNLAESTISWLLHCSSHLPGDLRKMKLHLSKMFVQSMRRHSSINQMSIALRQYLAERNHSKDMLKDWEKVDLRAVVQDVTLAFGSSQTRTATSFIFKYCKELESLIRRQAQMNEYSVWITNIVSRCIQKLSTQTPISPFQSFQSMKNPGCDFVLIWTSVGTRLLREFTLLRAKTFGTFHLLYLMVSDLGAQLMERFSLEERIKRLSTNVAVGEPPEAKENDLIGFLCDGDGRCPCTAGSEVNQCNHQIAQDTHTDGPFQTVVQIEESPLSQAQVYVAEPSAGSYYPVAGTRFVNSQLLNPGVTTVVSAHNPPIYCSLPVDYPMPTALLEGMASEKFQHTEDQQSSCQGLATGNEGATATGGDEYQTMPQGYWTSAGSPWYKQQLLRSCQHYQQDSQMSQQQAPQTPFNSQQGQQQQEQQQEQHPIYFAPNEQQEFFAETSLAASDGNYYRINTNVSINNPLFQRNVIAMATATATLTGPMSTINTEEANLATSVSDAEMEIPQQHIYLGISGSGSISQVGSNTFFVTTTSNSSSPFDEGN